MTRFMVAAVVLIAAVAVGRAQQAPPRDGPPPVLVGTSMISGTVITTETPAKPIGHAQMLIIGNDTGYIKIAESDELGRFAFSQLPAGRYLLGATKAPFLDASYGARRPGHPGTAVTVTEGQRVGNLTIKMTMGAVVTGAVTDNRGQPVPNANVRVIPGAWRTQQGLPTAAVALAALAPALGGVTDDRGVYRIYGIVPGDYLIVVSQLGMSNGDILALSADDIQAGLAAIQDAGRGIGGPPPFVGPPAAPNVARGGGSRVLTPGVPPPPVTRPGRPGTTSFVPVYFPDATDPANASSITVKAAEELGGVDIHTRLVTTARVEGFAYMPDGQPSSSIQISMAPAGPSGPVAIPGAFASTPSARPGADGAFRLSGVPPGHYTLTARTASNAGFGGARGGGGGPGGGPGEGAAPPVPLWASAEVTVFGEDISGIVLTLQPGLELSGKLVIDGTNGAVLPKKNEFRVTAAAPQAQSVLFGRGGLGGGPGGGAVDPDGLFKLTGLVPGTYALSATSTNGAIDALGQALRWTVQSIMIGGRDVTDLAFDLEPALDLTNCVVTITDRQQTVTGSLLDSAGHPAPDYTVIVFPTDSKYWIAGSRRIQTNRPSTDGGYEISGTIGLPPGTYYLAALDDLGPNEQYDPALLKDLAKTAIKLTLAPGERKKQTIRIR